MARLRKVTDQDGNGIAGANVRLVDRHDPSVIYRTSSINSMGYFVFTEISNTWDMASGHYEDKYLVYAHVSIGSSYEGYSDPFAVEAYANMWVVVKFPLSLST